MQSATIETVIPDERYPRPTRESGARQERWKPAKGLPEVPKVPGWSFYWGAYSIFSHGNEIDHARIAKLTEEGWTPVEVNEFPEFKDKYALALKGKQYIEIRGLLLMKMPSEMEAERREYYDRLSQSQVTKQSVNDDETASARSPGEQYFKVENPEVSSTTKLGSGNR